MTAANSGLGLLAELDAAEAVATRNLANGTGQGEARTTGAFGLWAAAAPAFPSEVLPPAMRAYVAAAAQSLGVPAEMVAAPMLGMAGALAGNRLHLVLKHSWREYASFYLAVVAPPGSAKTPALNLAKWPLDAMQQRAHKVHDERVRAHDDDLEAWKARPAESRGPKPRMPRQRHYYSTDLTIEALVAMLAHEPGIAIVRDEIGGWVAAMDQYRGGKGSDRQQFLSLWSGATIKADRKQGESAYARFPVVCVVGGIQPDLAGDLHHAAQKRDGFVERVLLLVPDVGVAPWSDASPTPEQFRDVLALFRALDALVPAGTADDTAPAGTAVHLSREAKALWVAWHNENAALIAAAHGLAAGFYAKLPAHVARLALVLHALHHPTDPGMPVSAERMADAVELGEFFRAHIHRFLALLHATVPTRFAGRSARIVRILRILRTESDTGWASRSDLLRRLGNVKADELTDELAALQAAGTVEQRRVDTATKPTEQWRLVAPVLCDPGPKYSNYSNNPPGEWHAAATERENLEKFEYFESPNGNEATADVWDGEEVLV